jgi:hypothetical protein
LVYSVPASVGSYSWTVLGVNPGSNYKINIWDTSNATIISKSPNYFSIVAATTTTPYLIISDVSDITSSYAPSEKISFSVKGMESDVTPASKTEGFNVQAYIYDSPRTKTYAGTNGSYDPNSGLWNVALTAPTDSSLSYDLEIFLYCGMEGSVCWSKYGSGMGQVTKLYKFTLSPTQPSITVLSPNGGEVWEIGKTYTIKWSFQNLPSAGNIAIWLLKRLPSESSYTLARTLFVGLKIPQTSAEWMIPTDLPIDSYYKIQVVIYNLSGWTEKFNDKSDTSFRVVSSSTSSGLGNIENQLADISSSVSKLIEEIKGFLNK